MFSLWLQSSGKSDDHLNQGNKHDSDVEKLFIKFFLIATLIFTILASSSIFYYYLLGKKLIGAILGITAIGLTLGIILGGFFYSCNRGIKYSSS